MEEISYNQAMLALLCQTSPNSVSRFIAQHNVESIKSDKSSNKRYDLQHSRIITDNLYASSRRPLSQQVQVFYNFKGGTGKTSLCYQVAYHLTMLGFSVLALDLDPQGHLSSIMRIPEDWDGPTIYDVMINGIDFEEAIVPVFPGLDLLPANISMTRIEVPLSTKTKREEKLSQIIAPMRNIYDFIVLDTNPTISTLNMNALVASDRVNVVCETQPFSLAGLRILVEEMINFYGDMGLEPNYCIIPNKYEIKTATAQEVLGALRSEFSSAVLSAVVRKSEEINIAAKKKLPISAFCRPKSTAFEDIMDLVHELVKQSQQIAKTQNQVA